MLLTRTVDYVRFVNKSFENVATFKYLTAKVEKKFYSHGKVKCRLNSEVVVSLISESFTFSKSI
jgi:hypothetical protein